MQNIPNTERKMLAAGVVLRKWQILASLMVPMDERASGTKHGIELVCNDLAQILDEEK